MKRTFAILLSAAMALTAFPVSAGAALPRGAATSRISLSQPGQNAGEVSGNATRDGKPLANYKVQLRNTDTKALVGDQRTGQQGEFKFTGLPAGNYVVETVDDKGNIIATSTAIALTAGAMIAGNVGVVTSAAVAGAAGGGMAASTVVILAGASIAGVSAAVVAVTNNASPSR